MAISNLYPAEAPTLNLNFANSRTLDRRITLTRTTTATYMDSNGLIRTAPANTPRFHHQYINGQVESLGLLIERDTTNFLPFTNYSASNGLVNVSLTQNAATAPDGTNTAVNVTGNPDVTSLKYTNKVYGTSTQSTYTFSIFAKYNTEQFIVIRMNDNGGVNDVQQRYDILNGVKSGNLGQGGTATGGVSTITPYPNGWYRLTVTCTFTSALTQIQAAIWLFGYQNTSTTNGVYLWGPQLEQRSYATSYFPTTSAGGASRGADRAFITGTNFSSWYNTSEGTLFASARSFAVSGTLTGVAALNLPSDFGPNRVDLRFDQGGASYVGFNSPPGLVLSRTSGYTLVNPKYAVGYKTNIQKFVANGSLASATASFTPSPTITHLQIGTFDNFSYHLDGCIAQLTYYPMLLSDAQLQNITK